jgi:hypothetical protein
MASVSSDSLNWALTHLQKQGDTDLFPRPFEIDVLASTIPALQSSKTQEYVWGPARHFLIPKADLSVRRATQLDPLDSLYLAAIIREVGDRIEKRRVPASEHAVFSYRFNPTDTGLLYGISTGWKEFWSWSRNYAANASHVLILDVVDFYNQIYHHSVENLLLDCGVGADLTKAITRLLSHLTGTISRGIPVGPHSSHLLAELVLSPLDNYLLQRQIKFTRYVDDIHVFCQSRDQAKNVYLELANLLDTPYKLTFASDKQSLLPSDQFQDKASHMLREQPIDKDEEELLEIFKDQEDDPYVRVSIDDVDPELLQYLSKNSLEHILDTYLSANPRDYVRMRWLLRRLSQVGAPGALDFVLNNLDELAPCFRDVAGYILSSFGSYEDSPEELGTYALEALELPEVRRNEYLRCVLLSIFASEAAFNHLGDLLEMFGTVGSSGQREIVLAAAKGQATVWVQNLRDKMGGMDPWLRRAALHAFAIVPRTEREHLFRSLRHNGTLLERAVMDAV